MCHVHGGGPTRRKLIACHCAAYPFPHKAQRGLCRYPDPPTKRHVDDRKDRHRRTRWERRKRWAARRWPRQWFDWFIEGGFDASALLSDFWLLFASGLVCLSEAWEGRDPQPRTRTHVAEGLSMQEWLRLEEMERAEVVEQYAQRKPRAIKLGYDQYGYRLSGLLPLSLSCLCPCTPTSAFPTDEAKTQASQTPR